MPNRKFSADETYRYGFNGKEMENEIKGEGAQYDYGFRIYDSRLNRFLSVDPLTPRYPMLTPYQYATNNPILNIDLDGLEGRPWYTYDEKWKRAYLEQSPKVWKGVFKGLGKRAIGVLDFMITWSPWNVSHENAVEKEHQIGAVAHAITNPKQTANKIKEEVKQWSKNLTSSDPEKVGDAIAGGIMFGVDLIGGFKSVAAITKILQGGKYVSKIFSTASIRTSQTSANGVQFYIDKFSKTGHFDANPIDIVKMEDGIYTSVDHARIMAAEKLGINVEARAHNFKDPLDIENARRFMPEGTPDDLLPKTWGEAVKQRIKNQGKKYSIQNPNGSFVRPKINS